MRITTSEGTKEYGEFAAPAKKNDDPGVNVCGGCCKLGVTLLAVGFLCYGIAESSCINPAEKCPTDFRDGAKVTMIVGGSMICISGMCVAAIAYCLFSVFRAPPEKNPYPTSI